MSTVQYPHLRRGVACALLGGVFWGLSANCAEILMGEFGVPVNWITAVRMALSAAFFLTLSAVTMRRQMLAILRDGRSLLLVVAFSLLGVTLTQVSYLSAISYAGAPAALLLEQLGLVLIMLYVCARARRAPRARELAGLAFALAGLVLISTQGDPSTLSIPFLGLAWGLVSAVSLAFYNLLPVYPLKRYGSFVVTGLAMLVGCVVVVVAFQPWSYEVSMPIEGWCVFAVIVLVGTILAYLLYVQGVKDAGPTRASLLGSVEPVSAMVISVVWLGGTVSLFDVLGAVAIVAMIVLVTEREPGAESEGEPDAEPEG